MHNFVFLHIFESDSHKFSTERKRMYPMMKVNGIFDDFKITHVVEENET